MVLAAGKADVNARDPVGRTALIAAAKTGKGEAIKALVLCKVLMASASLFVPGITEVLSACDFTLSLLCTDASCCSGRRY